MSADLGALIPELQPAARELLNLAGRAGVQPRITSTLRSNAEQVRLYRAFQAGARKYPVAPPGTSAHEYGFAFDMVVAGDQNQLDLGQVWQSWGGVWGPSDAIHFEYPGFRQAVAATAQPSPGAPTGAASPWAGYLATAVDIAIGLNPLIGYTELVAWLLSLGFPESEILKFLSGPAEYLVKG